MERARLYILLLVIAGIVLILIAAAIFLIGPGDSLVAPTPTPTSALTGRDLTLPPSLSELAELYPGLASILTDPELDTVYKEFLLAYEEGGVEAARELAEQRGLLTHDDKILVTLVLDTTDNAALVEQLEANNVEVTSAFEDRVNIAIPLAVVEEQLESEDPGAIFADLTELEHVIAVRLPEQRIPDGSTIPGEGVALVGADVWHQAGYTGAGVRIGVLDLGFAGYENLLGRELPDSVLIESFGAIDPYEVHGTACAEIVHEVAPGAELYLAWYDGSDAAMGNAVQWLQGHGVHIITHSAGALAGPRDGTGWDARLIDRLASEGILWVNSSGNEAQRHYRAVFTDSNGNGIHEFAPGVEAMALYNYGYVRVALNWDDDWERASEDYDMFLVDSNGNQLASSQDLQSGQYGNEPIEWIQYMTEGDVVYVMVTEYSANRAVTLDIFVDGAEVAYPTPSYSLCPPGDSMGALTVGAVNWWDDSLAEYSSQGPTSDGRLKPEIAGPAGVSGNTYGSRGFDGTSASTPHVAGAAALTWQAYPSYSRQDVTSYLLNQALDLGPSGPDTGFGYGRLQMGAAPSGQALPLPTTTPQMGGVTPVPLPSPTPVPYVMPTPMPSPGGGISLLALTGLGLVVGGLGCVGVFLLLIGLVGMIVLWRRAARPRPPRGRPPARRMPPPRPGAPPPPGAPPSAGPGPQPSPPARPPAPPRDAPPPARPAPEAAPPPSPAPSPPPARPATPPKPSPAQPEPQAPPSQPAKCSSCGEPLRTDSRFCAACGAPQIVERQPLLCSNCGAPLREGARFCARCGHVMGD